MPSFSEVIASRCHAFSINDVLPPEILHCIFEYLEFDDYHDEVLSACMRVCKLWHSLARPHFFAWVSVRRDQERFSDFCHARLEMAGWIKSIDFYGASWACASTRQFSQSCEAFDVESLVSILPLLPSLRAIRLLGHDNRTAARDGLWSPSKLVRLQQLCLDECEGVGTILPILWSLFTVDTLLLDAVEVDVYRESTILYHPSTRPQSIVLPNLALIRVYHVHPILEFLDYVLVPHCLRTFAAECWANENLPAVTRFLRSDASSNLLSISIDLELPGTFRNRHKDPVEGALCLPAAVKNPLLRWCPYRRRRNG